MTDVPIPVRMIGPGSQPADDPPLVVAVPREIDAFRMPEVPAQAEARALAGARDVIAAFLRELERWSPAREPAGPRVDLSAVTPDALALVNEMLGEGEVSVRVDGAPGIAAHRIQESVFTGLWRVCAFDGARQAGDWLEAGGLPQVVEAAARAGAGAELRATPAADGAMNSPALLAEIAAQMRSRRADGRAHVVNLTLFPLTPEDHAAIDAALPAGPVAIVSRGFGHCRIGSTRARDVWRVRYYNSMSTLILDTIEVVAVPEAARAAVEDLEDSRTRLAELVDWIADSEREARDRR